MKKILTSLMLMLSLMAASAQNISINDMFNIYNASSLLKAGSLAKLLGFELDYTDNNDDFSTIVWTHDCKYYNRDYVVLNNPNSAYFEMKYVNATSKPVELTLCIRNRDLFERMCDEIGDLDYKYKGSNVTEKGISHTYHSSNVITVIENNGKTYMFVISELPKAQKAVLDDDEDVISFQLVEEKPSFRGGDANEFSKWVNSRLVYPEIAKENGVQGRVVLMFTVDTDGTVKNVRVARGIDPALDKEAVRVVSSSPKWTPGKQKGRPVRVNYTFPVIFQLK